MESLHQYELFVFSASCEYHLACESHTKLEKQFILLKDLKTYLRQRSSNRCFLSIIMKGNITITYFLNNFHLYRDKMFVVYDKIVH